MMAKAASSKYFLFFIFFLLIISTSATLVGFSYNERLNTSASSSDEVITSFDSFIKLNNVSSKQQIRVFVADQRGLNLSSVSNSSVASVDLYLNLSLVVELMQSELSAISWLETNVLTSHPHVDIKSIILSCGSEEFAGQNVLPLILSALKSFHSVLSRVHLDMKVKVSVAFPLPLLENLNTSHQGEIGSIFGFIKKTGSVVIIEAGIDKELSMADFLVQSLIRKAIKATSVFPDSDVLINLVMTSPLVLPSAEQVAEFTENVSKFLENFQVRDRVDELYAEVSSMGESVQEGLKMAGERIFSSLSQRRELVNNLETAIHDTFNPVNPPPTIFATTPISTAPVTIPPGNNPTPTIVTVPSTNPVTVTPANPDTTPLPFPSTTPVNVPPATPVNPAAPVTNPATTPAPITVPGAQPGNNPVTMYPAPAAGNVPGTTPPVTNPVQAPPATTTTNAPAIPGQSWCVAKSGVSESALQAALDYACGIGGAECSLIQQGGSCYNPNTVLNHASYAFNSYYQKNPASSSCDFGGTAMITNSNPSTGTCVYPTSSSSSSSTIAPPAQPTSTAPPATPTTTTPPATPTTTTPPATTTSPSPGASGSVTPPTVQNSSYPASGFGMDSPPVVNTSTSSSPSSQPSLSFFTLIASFATGIIIILQVQN